MGEQRVNLLRLWPYALLVPLGAALFGSTATSAVQVADSGELVIAACKLGVAHPPGYPLFTLLGHAACQLPWSTAAARVTLVSVLAGICALLSLCAIVRRITGNSWAAFTAALCLAVGPIFWRQCSQPEVFALHVALSLALVQLSLVVGSARTQRRHLLGSLGLGLIGGLALANHHSAVLLAPLPAAAVLWPGRGAAARIARVGAACLGLCLGLLPYLQLLLADPAVIPRWGETGDWAGLLHHVLRRDYGTLRLAVGGGGNPLSSAGALLVALPEQLGWLLAPFALWGVVLLLVSGSDRPLARVARLSVRRDLALLLGLLPFLCGPLFALLFNIEAEGIGLQVLERFFVLPSALLAVALGVGLAWADRRWLAASAERRRAVWRGVALAVVAAMALLAFRKADLSESYTVEDYAANALAAAARDAMIVGNGDVRLWETGDAEAVRTEVLRKLNAARGGGLIFQSDHSVSSEVAGETYDTVVRTVREYGTYPIELGDFGERV